MPTNSAEQDFYSDIVNHYVTMVKRFIPGYEDELVPMLVDRVNVLAEGRCVLDIG